jgi:hypothetical protein
MGRLDDIVARNQKALSGDNLVVQAVGKLGADHKPAEPVASFTLPSQRKSGTAVWKVLVLMVLLGTAMGIYECHQMDVVKRDDERRLREVR